MKFITSFIGRTGKIFALLFLLASTGSGMYAQSAIEFFRPIEKYETTHGGDMILTISLPLDMKLKKEAEVRSLQSFVSGIPTDQLCDSKVSFESREGDELYYRFSGSNLADGNMCNLICIKVYPGDHEAVQPFFDLHRLAIELRDVEEKVIFGEIEYLLGIDHPQELMDQLIEDVRYTGTEMRKQMTPPDIEKGAFEGKDVFEAMEQADDQSVRAFLDYMIGHPRKYMGHTWKISEIWATWALEGAPGLNNGIGNDLLQHSSHAARVDFLNQFRRSEILIALKELDQMAQEDKSKGRISAAERKFLMMVDLGIEFDLHDQVGSGYFGLGDLYSGQEKHERSADAYMKATKAYKKADDLVSASVTLNNAGSAYNHYGEHKKALKVLRQAVDYQKQFDTVDSDIVRTTLALSRLNLGKAYHGLKKYQKAIDSFYEGIGLLDGRHTELAYKRRAALFYGLAEAHEALGNSEKAAECLSEALQAILAASEVQTL